MEARTRQPATRSAHRRRSVTQASATVLRRRGFDAVSYRSVAQEANVPEQTIRAYFHSRDDLRAAGLQYMLNGWIGRAEDFIRRLPSVLTLDETARLIVEVATVHEATAEPFTRGLISVIYERYVQAGKHVELRSLINEYNTILADLVGRVLVRNGRVVTPEQCRAILAVVDGTVIYELAAGESPVPRAIQTLEFAIPKLCGEPSPPRGGSERP
jgi:DNA-binding transcriptional regulator YbjK